MDDPKWETWNWQKFLETAQAITIDEDGDGDLYDEVPILKENDLNGYSGELSYALTNTSF